MTRNPYEGHPYKIVQSYEDGVTEKRGYESRYIDRINNIQITL